MKKTVYILAVVFLLLVFGVSAFFVGSYIIESREQARRNEMLAGKINQNRPVASMENNASAEETVPEGTFSGVDLWDENGILLDYSEIYAQNPDLVGWIRIDGTKLNNPVVQTPDRPNFYLDHDFDGNSSAWGAIYAREECDVNAPSDNVTLYGHNMRDGSMFAALNDYVYKETWENNPLIIYDTLYEYHVYEIFAVFKTSANIGQGFTYHNMIEAGSKEEFDNFIAQCKQLSFYDTGITPQYGENTICLSTCEYTLDNGRLVVAARRIS